MQMIVIEINFIKFAVCFDVHRLKYNVQCAYIPHSQKNWYESKFGGCKLILIAIYNYKDLLIISCNDQCS